MRSTSRSTRIKALVATAVMSGAAMVALAQPASASTDVIGGGTPVWWSSCETTGLCLFYTANGTGASFKTSATWIANFDGSWAVYGESGSNNYKFSKNSVNGQSNGSCAQVRNAAHSAANDWNADGVDSCIFVSPNFTGNADKVVTSGNLNYALNNEASYYTCT